jgi:hypothetical protein
MEYRRVCKSEQRQSPVRLTVMCNKAAPHPRRYLECRWGALLSELQMIEAMGFLLMDLCLDRDARIIQAFAGRVATSRIPLVVQDNVEQ